MLRPSRNSRTPTGSGTGARERELVRHNIDLILASMAVVEGAVLVSNDAIFPALAAIEPQLLVENWAA